MMNMKLEFKYTNELVSYLLNIEKYKTALEYLYLPTRTKQKLMYDAKLKKTHFSTSIEGNVLSLKQVENVINQKTKQVVQNCQLQIQGNLVQQSVWMSLLLDKQQGETL